MAIVMKDLTVPQSKDFNESIKRVSVARLILCITAGPWRLSSVDLHRAVATYLDSVGLACLSVLPTWVAVLKNRESIDHNSCGFLRSKKHLLQFKIVNCACLV